MKLLDSPAEKENLLAELPRGPICEPKKVSKPLEGLAGCKNIWKEAPIDRSNKGNTECRICGGMGHNSRTCPTNCVPCVRNMETFQLANGDMISLDLGPEQ